MKRYKELWKVEDRAWSWHPRSVRTAAAYEIMWEWIRWNPLWKQKIMSWELNISTRLMSPHQRCSTHESLLAVEGTPYSWFEGDLTDKSRAASSVARWEQERKHPLHGQENLHHQGAVQLPKWLRFMLKRLMRWRKSFQGCKEAITLPVSWFGRGCPFRGWHLYIFARKRWKLVPECIKRTYYKELWILWTQPSSVVRNVSSSRTLHKAKTTKEWLRRNILTFIIAEDWPSGNPHLNPLDYNLWPLFKDVACQKHHNNLESLKKSLMTAVAEKGSAAIAEWLECLKTCIETEGSNFEGHYDK